MIRLGIWFAGGLHTSRAVQLAARAEADGLDSVWIAEGYYARDAFTPLAAIASATNRLLLGTGVVNCYSRHPATLAMTFATLDEYSGGRAVIGIGSGERHMVHDHLGYDFSKPGTAVVEAAQIIRQLLAGNVLDFSGQVFQASGFRLAFRPPRSQIPIYVGAVGRRMCALAGEIGDGIYYPPASPHQIARASRWVKRAALAAGRNGESIDHTAMIVMAVSGDPERARRAAAPVLGLILTGPPGEVILAQNGLDPGEAEKIRRALAVGGVRSMASAVTDEILEELAVVGTRERCLTKLRELEEAGATHLVASMIGEEPELVIETLATYRQ